MNRSLFACVCVAAGLAWTAIDQSSVLAAGKELQGGTAPDEGPAKRIDDAIQAYENRTNQELEQTRGEIAKHQKELGEMVELQLGLVVSVAELQAEMRVQQMAVEDEAGGGAPGAGGGSAPNRDEQRKRLRSIELNRELRGVLENLRNVVSQKRNEIDQLVIQLRNLRTQQRQMAAAEAERNKQAQAPEAPKPNQD
jgi:hypothetical protein